MSLFVLHRPHGMHVFNRLPGFFSSQVDLLGSRPVKTQSYVIRDDDDDDDDVDNDHQIQSAGDHCRSLPHDRPGTTEHRRGAQIQRRLHGMGMDRQLSTIPSALLPVTRSSR